jgi:hypothetical protein
MRRFYIGGLAALCLAVCPAVAQETTPQDPATTDTLQPGAHRSGAHLYSASIFGNYFSNGLPANFTSQVANLQSDIAYGGSISMGWVKTGTRFNGLVNYTPTYTGRMRYSDLHSFGHDLNMNVGYQFNPKWTWRVGASGSVRDLQRVLFSSTQAAQIASAPGTFSGLASSLTTGQFANNQLASILTAPSLVNPATGNILYGNRYLTTAVNMSVSYARSERFQITAGVTGARSQGLSTTLPAGTPQPLLQHTTTGGAQASFNYGLTQRLSLSGNWYAQRSFAYRQGDVTNPATLIHNVSGSLGYVVGARWLFTAGGGVGFVPSVLRFSAAGTGQTTPGGTRYIAHGSVVYRFFSQTLAAVGSRAVSNAYGFGGGVSVTGDLAWHWNRPGSAWGMSVDGGYQSYEIQGASSLSGWRGMASLNRMLSRRLMCGIDYSLLRNIGSYSGVNYALTRGTARVVVTWSFSDQMGPGRNDSNF